MLQNSWTNKAILVYYYSSILMIDFTIMFMVNYGFKNVLADIMYLIQLIMFVFSVFVNYLVLSIARQSHQSYNNLNSIQCRKVLPLRHKFKVMDLIERLSGPVIGFYCFDLFPVTSFKIFMFYLNCMSYFILFMSIFYE